MTRSMNDQRRRTAHRKRRILLNNEGGDLLAPEAVTPEGFLSIRTTPLAGTDVDTILYCSHFSFTDCAHKTKVGQITKHARTFIDQGCDPLQIIIDFCHGHDMEAFYFMRMNDVHDCKPGSTRPQFKTDHPEWLLGVEGDFHKSDDFIGEFLWWGGVDYEHPEVRDMAFRLIEEVCHNFDVDGVEMDFFRHPVFSSLRAGAGLWKTAIWP